MTDILPINETADKIWAAIQRVLPVVTKPEILAILREAYDAPTASETPGALEDWEKTSAQYRELARTLGLKGWAPERDESDYRYGPWSRSEGKG